MSTLTSRLITMREQISMGKKTSSKLYVLLCRRHSLPLLLVYPPCPSFPEEGDDASSLEVLSKIL